MASHPHTHPAEDRPVGRPCGPYWIEPGHDVSAAVDPRDDLDLASFDDAVEHPVVASKG